MKGYRTIAVKLIIIALSAISASLGDGVIADVSPEVAAGIVAGIAILMRLITTTPVPLLAKGRKK